MRPIRERRRGIPGATRDRIAAAIHSDAPAPDHGPCSPSRRLAAVPLAALLAATPTAVPAPARAAAPPPCAVPAISLPVLAADGAVIVPARVDGVAAAAEVNPRAYPSYVSADAGLPLPRQGSASGETLAGHEDGRETTLATLELGDATIPGLHAVAVSEPPRPSVAGLPVLLTLGADVLGGYRMLLDLPKRRLFLFAPDDPACPDPAALLRPPTVSVPLSAAPGDRIVSVDAVLDGLPVPMEIDLASNDSIVPRAVARRLGLTAATLQQDPQVYTRSAASAATRVGVRHAFHELALGTYRVPGPRMDVLRDLNYAALGLDFFHGKAASFDFPGHRLTFEDVPPVTDAGRASSLSSVRTRNADTAVEQGPPRSRP